MRAFVSGWTVVKEISMSQSPSRIFKAFTTPSQLNAWFTHGAKVDLRVNGRYSNLDGDKGRFLEIVPGKRLRFTWDNPGHAPNSTVEVLLKRIRDRTTVTLIQAGFTKKKDFEHYASQESGWNWALENLRSYLNGRKTTDYEIWLKRHKS